MLQLGPADLNEQISIIHNMTDIDHATDGVSWSVQAQTRSVGVWSKVLVAG